MLTILFFSISWLVSQEIEQGHGWVNFLSHKASKKVPYWYLTDRWAGQEDPKLFHSLIWHLGGDGWKVGSAVTRSMCSWSLQHGRSRVRLTVWWTRKSDPRAKQCCKLSFVLGLEVLECHFHGLLLMTHVNKASLDQGKGNLPLSRKKTFNLPQKVILKYCLWHFLF